MGFFKSIKKAVKKVAINPFRGAKHAAGKAKDIATKPLSATKKAVSGFKGGGQKVGRIGGKAIQAASQRAPGLVKKGFSAQKKAVLAGATAPQRIAGGAQSAVAKGSATGVRTLAKKLGGKSF